jgi:Flp pilus assembly pilin Flp
MKKHNGQEAIEFILIASLIFIICTTAVILLGNKIGEFFENDSAVAITAKQKAPVYDPDKALKYQPDYQTTIPYTARMIDDQEVKIFDDGHAEFNVDGKLFSLPSGLISLQDTVLQEAAGSSGIDDIVKEVAYLIKKYNPEVPEVEIMYGTGSRNLQSEKCKKSWFSWKCKPYTEQYVGKAKVEDVILNAVAIKLDEHLVVIQKDQYCSGSQAFCGKYRIEGDYDEATGNFNGDVTNNQGFTGKYTTSVNTEEGLIFNTGAYTQNTSNVDKKKDSSFLGFGGKRYKTKNTGDWTITFKKESFKFSI